MLKGTTKIELTDVNTGETQVIEKHNAITGASQELFNPTLGHLTIESSLTSRLPAHTNLLGGLLLFDSKIEGDPLPLYAPEDVKLVGCARYGSQNGSSKYFGNYNGAESVFDTENKTAKLVYDFRTSEANGTINSICLTSLNGGYGVYASDFALKNSVRLASSIYATPTTKLIRSSRDRTTGIYNTGEAEHLFAVDIDNDVAHYFKVTDNTTIVMLKRRLGLKQYSIFGNNADIVGDPVTITVPIGINTVSNRNAYNFDVDTGALYIVSAAPSAQSASIAANANFTVTKIGLNDTSATQKPLTNTHTSAILPTTAYVYKNRVFLPVTAYSSTINGKSASNYNIVSFSLNDGSMASHGVVNGPSSYGGIPKSMYAADGRLYWQGYYDSTSGIGGLRVTNVVESSVDTNTTQCGVDIIGHNLSGSTYYPDACVPVLNHPMLFYLSNVNGSGSEGFYFMSHYLGTINNLASPIVKEDTQTMKITYTIQEV
jgi:hypothetical protein